MRPIAYPLEVGGAVTRIIEAGQGPVVLFIHGLGARADRWTAMVEMLADAGYRAITFDLPGHGFASKSSDGPTTVPELAEFATSLLDTLEIKRAVLVGTSLGAHIAAYAACANPSRFPRLVLVGALGIVPLARETAEAIRRNVKASAREQITAKLNYVMFDKTLVTPALVEEEFRMNNSPGALESFTRMGDYVVDGIERDYVADRLRAAYRPEQILLVWGADDHSVPLAVGEACKNALGGPELVVISQAGHVPYVEQKAAFAEAVLKFFRKQELLF